MTTEKWKSRFKQLSLVALLGSIGREIRPGAVDNQIGQKHWYSPTDRGAHPVGSAGKGWAGLHWMQDSPQCRIIGIAAQSHNRLFPLGQLKKHSSAKTGAC
jgi:hypothetical protein